MKELEFFNPTKVVFGRKSIDKLGQIAKVYGTRCLIVTRSLKSSKLAETIRRIDTILKEAGIETCIYDGVVPNPTVKSIDDGAEVGRAFKPDLVLGVGGGSAMDTAKCIAVGITHEGSIWDYCFFQDKHPTEKTLPFILVTTTSGTGSQVCANAVLTLTEHQHKSGVNGPYLYAKACIIDPELMVTVPEHITASTGFDVFCHAWESYTSVRANAMSAVFSREAIRIVLKALPVVLMDLNNVELREQMAWADTLAGFALNEAGVTVPHGIGMAIGGYYPHVMHGEALAYVYPAYMRFTWDSCIEKFAELYHWLKPDATCTDERICAEAACEEMDNFLKRIGMWLGWKDLKITEEGARQIAENTFRLGDHLCNTKVPNHDDVLAMIYDGRDR